MSQCNENKGRMDLEMGLKRISTININDCWEILASSSESGMLIKVMYLLNANTDNIGTM